MANNYFGLFAIWIIVLFPIYLTRKEPDKRFNEWKVDRIECTGNMCEKHSCELTPVDRYTQQINLNCENLTRPQNTVRVKYQAFYRFNGYRPFPIDFDLDVCDYMGNQTRSQPLMSAIMPDIIRHSNINHPCPFDGRIFVANISVRKSMMRNAPMPAGQYRVHMLVYSDVPRDDIYGLKLFVSVPSGKTTEDEAMG